MSYESDCDYVSLSNSHSMSGDLSTLEYSNSFLDETFGQSVKVTDYISALTLQIVVGVNILDERC